MADNEYSARDYLVDLYEGFKKAQSEGSITNDTSYTRTSQVNNAAHQNASANAQAYYAAGQEQGIGDSFSEYMNANQSAKYDAYQARKKRRENFRERWSNARQIRQNSSSRNTSYGDYGTAYSDAQAKANSGTSRASTKYDDINGDILHQRLQQHGREPDTAIQTGDQFSPNNISYGVSGDKVETNDLHNSVISKDMQELFGIDTSSEAYAAMDTAATERETAANDLTTAQKAINRIGRIFDSASYQNMTEEQQQYVQDCYEKAYDTYLEKLTGYTNADTAYTEAYNAFWGEQAGKFTSPEGQVVLDAANSQYHINDALASVASDYVNQNQYVMEHPGTATKQMIQGWKDLVTYATNGYITSNDLDDANTRTERAALAFSQLSEEEQQSLRDNATALNLRYDELLELNKNFSDSVYKINHSWSDIDVTNTVEALENYDAELSRLQKTYDDLYAQGPSEGGSIGYIMWSNQLQGLQDDIDKFKSDNSSLTRFSDEEIEALRNRSVMIRATSGYQGDPNAQDYIKMYDDGKSDIAIWEVFSGSYADEAAFDVATSGTDPTGSGISWDADANNKVMHGGGGGSFDSSQPTRDELQKQYDDLYAEGPGSGSTAYIAWNDKLQKIQTEIDDYDTKYKGGIHAGSAEKDSLESAADMYLQYADDAQINTMKYLAARGDKEGLQAYADAIMPSLKVAAAEEFQNMIINSTSQNAGAAIASVAANAVFSAGSYAIAGLTNLEDQILTKGKAGQSMYANFTQMEAATTQGLSMELQKSHMSPTAANFWAGTIVSMADNIAQFGLMGGGTSTALEINSKVVGAKLNEWIPLATMGINAGTASVQEHLNQGDDLWKSMLYGSLAGGVEIITEKIGVDNWIDAAAGKGTKGIIRAVADKFGDASTRADWKKIVIEMLDIDLKQAGSEGFEEVISEIADYFLDIQIFGDESEYWQSIENYMYGLDGGEPMSANEAWAKTMEDFMGQCLSSFAGGFVSGIGFGLMHTPNYLHEHNAFGKAIKSGGDAKVAAFITNGLKYEEGTQVHKIAQELYDRFIAPETKTGKITGKVKVSNDITAADIQRLFEAECELAGTDEAYKANIAIDMQADAESGEGSISKMTTSLANGDFFPATTAGAQDTYVTGIGLKQANAITDIVQRLMSGEGVTNREIKESITRNSTAIAVLNRYLGADMDFATPTELRSAVSSYVEAKDANERLHTAMQETAEQVREEYVTGRRESKTGDAEQITEALGSIRGDVAQNYAQQQSSASADAAIRATNDLNAGVRSVADIVTSSAAGTSDSTDTEQQSKPRELGYEAFRDTMTEHGMKFGSASEAQELYKIVNDSYQADGQAIAYAPDGSYIAIEVGKDGNPDARVITEKEVRENLKKVLEEKGIEVSEESLDNLTKDTLEKIQQDGVFSITNDKAVEAYQEVLDEMTDPMNIDISKGSEWYREEMKLRGKKGHYSAEHPNLIAEALAGHAQGVFKPYGVKSVTVSYEMDTDGPNGLFADDNESVVVNGNKASMDMSRQYVDNFVLDESDSVTMQMYYQAAQMASWVIGHEVGHRAQGTATNSAKVNARTDAIIEAYQKASGKSSTQIAMEIYDVLKTYNDAYDEMGKTRLDETAIRQEYASNCLATMYLNYDLCQKVAANDAALVRELRKANKRFRNTIKMIQGGNVTLKNIKSIYSNSASHAEDLLKQCLAQTLTEEGAFANTGEARLSETKAAENVDENNAEEVATAALDNLRFSLNEDGTFDVITTFSGAETVGQGFVGLFTHIAACEYDHRLAFIGRLNNGGVDNLGSVLDWADSHYLRQFRGKCDYFHASPVCHDYSDMKREAQITEEDKAMDMAFAKATATNIEDVNAPIVTIENAASYLESEEWQVIKAKLDEMGYKVVPNVYQAAEYGCPTRRERMIVYAVKQNSGYSIPEIPKPTGKHPGWYAAITGAEGSGYEGDLLPTLNEITNEPDWLITRAKRSKIDFSKVTEPMFVLGGTPEARLNFSYASDGIGPALVARGKDARLLMPNGDGTYKWYQISSRAYARMLGLPDTFKFPEAVKVNKETGLEQKKKNGDTWYTGGTMEWDFDENHNLVQRRYARENNITVVGNGMSPAVTHAVVKPLYDMLMEHENAMRSVDGESFDDVQKRMENPYSSVRWSIGGEASKTADLDALNAAKEMRDDGDPAYYIWRVTGWYVGADDRWKYEISNADLTIDFDELESIYGSYEGRYLSDVVKSESLYSAYPQLKDYSIESRSLNGYFGMAYPESKVIVIDTKGTGHETDIRGTIIHEIQHMIQSIEGFDNGSSIGYFDKGGEIASGYRSYGEYRDTKVRELRKNMDDIVAAYPSLKTADELYAEHFYNLRMERSVYERRNKVSAWANLMPEVSQKNEAELALWENKVLASEELFKSELSSVSDDSDQELSIAVEYYAALANEVANMMSARFDDAERDSYDLYRNTTGEIEANDVAWRDKVGETRTMPNIGSPMSNIRVPSYRYSYGSIPSDIGYHAGDLGKSEQFFQQGAGRHTGHFGTGTYFVGDTSELKYSGYGDRPVEKVNFDKYNLFRPLTEYDGLELHEFLKGVNTYHPRLRDALDNIGTNWRIQIDIDDALYDYNVSEESATDTTAQNLQYLKGIIDTKLDEYTRNSIYERARTRYEEAQSADLSIDEDELNSRIESMKRTNREMSEEFGFDIEESDEEIRRQILEDIGDTALRNKSLTFDEHVVQCGEKALKEYAEEIHDIDSWIKLQRTMTGIRMDISDEQFMQALSDVADTIAQYPENTWENGLDSASTIFMKSLGYEGIDVRGIDGLDNVGYGSVIYDLKGEDLARKQEIGTARYSIDTDSMDTDYLAAVESGDMETAQRMVDRAAESAFSSSKIRDEDGKLLVVYHGSDSDFNVFDKTKSRANMDINGHFFSPWELDASGYGSNVRKFYLNITNPASESMGYKALRMFQGQNNAGVKAREYLQSLGYDGVNNGNEEYIAFDSSQIKSADAITYDDAGEIIPLSERFNDAEKDIRYSVTDAQYEAFKEIGYNKTQANSIMSGIRSMKKAGYKSSTVSADGRTCVINGYSGVIYNKLLPIETEENMPDAMSLLDKNFDAALSKERNYQIVELPSIKDLRDAVRAWKKTDASRGPFLEVDVRKDDGTAFKISVNANYLIDMMKAMPNGFDAYAGRALDPLVFYGEDGKGLISTVRRRNTVGIEKSDIDSPPYINRFLPSNTAAAEASVESTPAVEITPEIQAVKDNIAQESDTQAEVQKKAKRAKSKAKSAENAAKRNKNPEIQEDLNREATEARREAAELKTEASTDADIASDTMEPITSDDAQQNDYAEKRAEDAKAAEQAKEIPSGKKYEDLTSEERTRLLYEAIFSARRSGGGTKISKFITNTVENSSVTKAARENIGMEKLYDAGKYEPTTWAGDLDKAVARIDASPDAWMEERKKLQKAADEGKRWEGADLDVAMMILAKLQDQNISNRDFKDTVEWIKSIRGMATEAGQFINSFKKYTNTAQYLAVEAINNLENGTFDPGGGDTHNIGRKLMQEDIDRLTRESERADEQLRKLQEEQDRLNAELESLMEKLAEQEGANANMGDYVDEADAEAQELQKELSDLRAEFKKLNDALVSKMSEADVLEAEGNEIRSQRDALKEELDLARQIARAVAGENSKLSGEIERLANRLEEIYNKTAEQYDQNAELADKRDDLRTQMDAAKASLEFAKLANRAVIRDNESLQKQIKRTLQKIAAAYAENERLVDLREYYSGELDEAQWEKANVQAANSAERRNISSLQARIENARAAIKRMKAEHETLIQQREELQDVLDGLLLEKSGWTADNAKARAQIRGLEKRIANTIDRIELARSLNSELRNAINKMLQGKANADDVLKQLTDENSILSKFIGKINKDITGVDQVTIYIKGRGTKGGRRTIDSAMNKAQSIVDADWVISQIKNIREITDTAMSSDRKAKIEREILQMATIIDKVASAYAASNDEGLRMLYKNDLIDAIAQLCRDRGLGFDEEDRDNMMEKDFDYLFAFGEGQIANLADDYRKRSTAQKLSTIQYISQLMNLRTAARNVTSNGAFTGIESLVCNTLGVASDKIVSQIGKAVSGGVEIRSVARTWNKGNIENIKAGSYDRSDRARLEVKYDVEVTKDSEGRYERVRADGDNSRRTFKMAEKEIHGTIEHFLSQCEKYNGYLLNVSDEFFKGGIYNSMVQSYASMVEQGLLTQEQANALATQEMLYATFQDDTFLGTILNGFHSLANTGRVRDSSGNLIYYKDGKEVDGPANGKAKWKVGAADFGVGDFVCKYRGVPGALVTRAIEYSPLGYIKATYNLAQFTKIAKDAASVEGIGTEGIQRMRNASMGYARATTGSGIMAMIAWAFMHGLVKRKELEKNNNVSGQYAAQGMNGTQLNVSAFGRLLGIGDTPEGKNKTDWLDGDDLWDIGFMDPISSMVTMGTRLGEFMKSAGCDSLTDYAKMLVPGMVVAAGRGTVDAFTDLSMMQFFSEMIQDFQYSETIGEGLFNLLCTVGIEGIAGMMPSIDRQIAQAFDPYYRNVYSKGGWIQDALGDKAESDFAQSAVDWLQQAYNKIAVNIPGLRFTVDKKTDAFGNEKKYNTSLPTSIWNAFFNPGKHSKYTVSDVLTEIENVYAQTGNKALIPNSSYSKIGNKWIDADGNTQTELKMTQDEGDRYKKTLGQNYQDIVAVLMDTDVYMNADAETQDAMLTEMKSYATYLANKEMIESKGGRLAENDWKNEESIMRAIAGTAADSATAFVDAWRIANEAGTSSKWSVTSENSKNFDNAYAGMETSEKYISYLDNYRMVGGQSLSTSQYVDIYDTLKGTDTVKEISYSSDWVADDFSNHTDSFDMNLTADQQMKYSATRFDNYAKYADEIVDSAAWKDMSSAERAEVMDDARSYANYLAKKELFDAQGYTNGKGEAVEYTDSTWTKTEGLMNIIGGDGSSGFLESRRMLNDLSAEGIESIRQADDTGFLRWVSKGAIDANYIAGLNDYSDGERAAMFSVLQGSNSSTANKMQDMVDAGLTWEEASDVLSMQTYITNTQETYEQDSGLNEQSRFESWINQQDYSASEKETILDNFKYFNFTPQKASTVGMNLIEAGLSESQAGTFIKGMDDAVAALGDNPKDAEVNEAKYNYIFNATGLTDQQRAVLVGGVQGSDSVFPKLDANTSSTMIAAAKKSGDYGILKMTASTNLSYAGDSYELSDDAKTAYADEYAKIMSSLNGVNWGGTYTNKNGGTGSIAEKYKDIASAYASYAALTADGVKINLDKVDSSGNLGFYKKLKGAESYGVSPSKYMSMWIDIQKICADTGKGETDAVRSYLKSQGYSGDAGQYLISSLYSSNTKFNK